MRLTFEEELRRPKLSQCAFGRKIYRDSALNELGIRIDKQIYDTCLSHSIINATQRHEKLEELMHRVKRIARLRHENRKDVAIGIEACRTVIHKAVRNGFTETDTEGIAHVNLRNGEGHFIGLKRIRDKLYIIDSLYGAAAEVKDFEELQLRSTIYAIREPRRVNLKH